VYMCFFVVAFARLKQSDLALCAVCCVCAVLLLSIYKQGRRQILYVYVLWAMCCAPCGFIVLFALAHTPHHSARGTFAFDSPRAPSSPSNPLDKRKHNSKSVFYTIIISKSKKH
jgi:lysylphosphatidylglycerol synthetase-like protein (DUF2156 family)